jgi:predicted metal-dependent phosphoesterase TrpH
MLDSSPRDLYKADLHVHSRYSGRVNHLRFLRARDCYSQPIDVYRTAKRRGMDLVTITDHDSIDGCLDLLDRMGELPDFVIGEEVTVSVPEFRHRIHIGVYDITEAQHREIQKLRASGEELIGYLRQNDILFVLNHFFHDFANVGLVHKYIGRMAELFDVFEVRNGTMQREHNAFVASLLRRYRSGARTLGMVGGSDSHTLRRIGRTYTASPARTREQFLRDIRSGRTEVFGPHSNHLSLAADIYGVVLRYYPTVLSLRNGEFPPLIRVKNFFLSVIMAPLLFVPYLAALHYAQSERQRIGLFSRLLLEPQAGSVGS